MAVAKSISSANELAKLMGVTHTAVNKWLKHDAWPFGDRPWPSSQLSAIKAWAAQHLQEDRAVDDGRSRAAGGGGAGDKTLTEAKRLLTLANAQLKNIELKEKKGEVHNIAECEQLWRERCALVKSMLLDRVPSTSAQEIEAKQRAKGAAISRLEITEVIRTHMEYVVNEFVAKAGG